jgi:hypothetical protein
VVVPQELTLGFSTTVDVVETLAQVVVLVLQEQVELRH